MRLKSVPSVTQSCIQAMLPAEQGHSWGHKSGTAETNQVHASLDMPLAQLKGCISADSQLLHVASLKPLITLRRGDPRLAARFLGSMQTERLHDLDLTSAMHITFCHHLN